MMADAWLGMGFRVEVVHFRDKTYQPPGDTVVVIDIHSNLERWSDSLPGKTIKILHATGSHWLTQNTAELTRLKNLRDRRGVCLIPRRQTVTTCGIENADHAVVLGGDFTVASFEFAGKPITRVPISSAYKFDWPEARDDESSRRRFLWIGSYGMVHKGLDLVLEAFASLPDLHLTVCGRPEKESDFSHHYHQELRNLKNIHLRGWLDMTSSEFKQISETHTAVIYPSSAEGGGGAVIHCMHAGMLPVCTWESSVDLQEFGIAVARGDVEAVREAAFKVASMAPDEIQHRCRSAWEHVRKVHTRESFAVNYRRFAGEIAAGL
jgi:glycosyltransferase involved in cell wall biosynthesis